MSPSILSIPAELTENALVLAAPRDVASFAQTCRSARALVYEAHDQHLWRRLFLEQLFDDPRVLTGDDASDLDCVDYKRELQRRVRLIRAISTSLSLAKSDELCDVLRELVFIARSAPSVLGPDSPTKSKDLAWIANLLNDHPLWCARADQEDPGVEGFRALPALSRLSNDLRSEPAASELWCYLGWRTSIMSRRSRELLVARNAARAFVYDMRNYRRDNLYGPYSDRQANVNWMHIANAITIIQCNLTDLGSLWIDTRPPLDIDAIRAYSAPGALTKRDPRDWAGVEGTWRRYVCFMDYRDLFTFNYSRNAYNPAFFEDDEFQEATRLIELTLRITRIGDVPTNPPLSPPLSETSGPSVPGSTSGTPPPAPSVPSPPAASAYGPILDTVHQPPQSHSFPKICFAGESRGGNGNEAKVKGTVRMTADGRVRWRFASIHDGHSQWSSEGVQIGEVCSAAGIVGTWTGVHHEDGDPAGPFWLWKVADDHPSQLHRHRH